MVESLLYYNIVLTFIRTAYVVLVVPLINLSLFKQLQPLFHSIFNFIPELYPTANRSTRPSRCSVTLNQYKAEYNE